MAAKLTYDDVQGLYRHHGPALLAYATSLLGDRTAAEDTVHEVFLEMLGKVFMPDEPRPYLFRAVRNRALNSWRGRERLTTLDHHEWLVKTEATMEAAIAIEKAMRDLPVEQREVVVMKVWGEMTLDEMAKVLEIPLNTVASRYRYALAKLREILNKKI
ncbi:MAG: sigma-70 family RNA polymerase sigma factor [Candidatus Angelobacter sp.]